MSNISSKALGQAFRQLELVVLEYSL